MNHAGNGGQGRARRWVGRGIRWTTRLVVGAILLVLAGLFVWALEDRSLPDLEAWHRSAPPEFRAEEAREGFDFEEYRALEERMFAELSDWMIPAERSALYMQHSRYQPGGPYDPAGFDPNWNRSTELVPEEIRGGALLVHGLSDSPYSMRSLAELLHARGLYVLCLRLPGHGTVPAGLLEVRCQDWTAAVEFAARHVVERIAGAGPFYVGGYSCGGALATQLAVESVNDATLRVPDHVFLFSPAIGISPLALASDWHVVFSWMPWFQKSKWLDIEPEFDPFKYNSFPKNAGAQMYALTQAVQVGLQALEDDGRTGELPPILAFQSVVDATIVAEDVSRHLFARLPENGSELIALDANTETFLEGLYLADPRAAVARLESEAGAAYRFTAITNHAGKLAVVARSRAPHASEPETTPIGLAWPADVYSLSHVAVPFPPDDPLYGYESTAGAGGTPGLALGRLALRGEKNVLRVPASQMLRLRANPFHAYVMQRIEETIE